MGINQPTNKIQNMFLMRYAGPDVIDTLALNWL